MKLQTAMISVGSLVWHFALVFKVLSVRDLYAYNVENAECSSGERGSEAYIISSEFDTISRLLWLSFISSFSTSCTKVLAREPKLLWTPEAQLFVLADFLEEDHSRKLNEKKSDDKFPEKRKKWIGVRCLTNIVYVLNLWHHASDENRLIS